MFGPSLTRPECVDECQQLLAKQQPPPVNPWWANKRYASERKAAGITFAKKATRASFRRRNSMKNKVVTKKTLKRMGLLNTLKKARTKTDKQPPQNDIEPTEEGKHRPKKDKHPLKKDKELGKNYKHPQTMTKASTKELYPSHHQSPPHKSL